MAIDKAVDSAVLDAGLKQIADAIREKGGTTDPIAFDDMVQAIDAISGAGFFTEIGTYIPAEDITLFDSPIKDIAMSLNGIIILPWTTNVSTVKDSLLAVFTPDTGNTIRLCVYCASSQTYSVNTGAFQDDSVCKSKYLRAGAEYLYAHS